MSESTASVSPSGKGKRPIVAPEAREGSGYRIKTLFRNRLVVREMDIDVSTPQTGAAKKPVRRPSEG